MDVLQQIADEASRLGSRAAGELQQLAQGAITGHVRSASLQSQVLPTLKWAPGPSSPETQRLTQRALGLVKPRLAVQTTMGPIVYAPAGDPDPGVHWPVVRAAGLAVAASALLGLPTLLKLTGPVVPILVGIAARQQLLAVLRRGLGQSPGQ